MTLTITQSILEFTLFIRACIETDRYNKRAANLDVRAEQLADRIINNAIANGQLIPAPGSRFEGGTLNKDNLLSNVYPTDTVKRRKRNHGLELGRLSPYEEVTPEALVASSPGETAYRPARDNEEVVVGHSALPPRGNSPLLPVFEAPRRRIEPYDS